MARVSGIYAVMESSVGMFEHRWNEPASTERAGWLLASCLASGDLIGLIGDLGAGKTLLVQGIARGLGVPPAVRVTSPTFTLINEYHGGRLTLYHADLYRIEDARELDELELDELCRSGNGVVCVEWSDRYPVLGRDYLEVRIRHGEDDQRVVEIEGMGTRGRALAKAWHARLM